MFRKKEINVDINTTEFSSAVAVSNNPVDLVRALQKRDYSVISIPEQIRLYLEHPLNAMAFGYGNWVEGAVLYTPEEYPKFLQRSPILDAVRNRTYSRKSNGEFEINEPDCLKLSENSFSFRDCSHKGGILSIQIQSFVDNPLILFLLGKDLARDYASFLNAKERTSMHVYLLAESAVRTKKSSFVRQAYLGGFHTCPKSPFPEGPCIDMHSGFVQTHAPHIDRVRGIRYRESL